MSEFAIPRRAFFGQIGAGAAASVTPVSRAPRSGWVIVEQGWEYNDEFHYESGAFPGRQLFFDRAVADAECRRLCDKFFSARTPAEFEVDWSVYAPDGDAAEFDETTVTWDQVRAAGFPDPYFVQELTTFGGDPI